MQSASRCVSCGRPLDGDRCPACGLAGESRFVHREIVLLVLLSAIVVIGFFVTHAIATSTRELRQRDAATWYKRGASELAAGRTDSAIRALRRATAIDRDHKSYRLALASALAAGRQDDVARQVLLSIRDLTPEDPEVNLQLARLEARREDLTGAVRYYQNALYGLWGGDPADARREVRVELIRYLLEHDQRGRALSELLILSGNLPDDVGSQNEAGQLFLSAGEPRRGLDHFRRALRLDAKNGAALAGAGEAAFEAGDYVVARRYLRDAARTQTAPDPAKVEALQEVTELVLTRDPLRPGLSLSQRRDRMLAGLAQARERLDACLAARTGPGGQGDAALQSLRNEADALEPALTPRRLRDDSDTLDAAVHLIYRIEERTADGCGAPSPLDRALLLIGRRHEADEQ